MLWGLLLGSAFMVLVQVSAVLVPVLGGLLGWTFWQTYLFTAVSTYIYFFVLNFPLPKTTPEDDPKQVKVRKIFTVLLNPALLYAIGWAIVTVWRFVKGMVMSLFS